MNLKYGYFNALALSVYNGHSIQSGLFIFIANFLKMNFTLNLKMLLLWLGTY